MRIWKPRVKPDRYKFQKHPIGGVYLFKHIHEDIVITSGFVVWLPCCSQSPLTSTELFISTLNARIYRIPSYSHF